MARLLHPRISLSGVTTGDWSLGDDLQFCRAVGVGHLGIPFAKVEAVGEDAAVALIDASGIGVANMLWPSAFHLAQPDLWPREVERFCAAIDLAARVDAECLYFTSGPPGRLLTDAAAVAFGEAVEPVLEHAQRRSVRLAIEPNHALRRDLGFVHSLHEALQVVEPLELDLCVELNNCWIELGLHSVFERGVDRFALVQVSDFVIGTLCTPERAVPGDGDIPIEELVTSLLTAGYTGRFDLEMVGSRIEAEGAEYAARRGLAWLDGLLTRLGA